MISFCIGTSVEHYFIFYTFTHLIFCLESLLSTAVFITLLINKQMSKMQRIENIYFVCFFVKVYSES